MQAKLFNKKISNCPLCYSDTISDKYIISRYNEPFSVAECATCGFIFMNPAFSDEAIVTMYSKEYYTGKTGYTYYDERKAKKYSEYVWRKRIACIHKYIKSGNFLDIGCSFGGLLEQASKWYTPYGIELSEYSAQYAQKKFGNSIHHGTLSDHPFKENSFSVITMIELIEHLRNPIETLSECYSLLKPGGLLVIQTANMDGQQAKKLKEKYAYYMPGHLSYFSKKNLSLALENTGFSKKQIFYPVEFGLLPKLQKSRGDFQNILDYTRWLRITWYHLLSKIHWKDFAMTSSMVIYAFK